MSPAAIRVLYTGTDLRGSLRVACDAQGKPVAWFDYDPFGRTPGEEASTGDAALAARLTRRYTGQGFESESALYDYGARRYDTDLARFVSPDPAHEAPSPYVYCANDPVDHVDPDGSLLIRAILYKGWLLIQYEHDSGLISFWIIHSNNPVAPDHLERVEKVEQGEEMAVVMRRRLDRILDKRLDARVFAHERRLVAARRNAYWKMSSKRAVRTNTTTQQVLPRSLYRSSRPGSGPLNAPRADNAIPKGEAIARRDLNGAKERAMEVRKDRTTIGLLVIGERFYNPIHTELLAFLEDVDAQPLLGSNNDLRTLLDAMLVAELHLSGNWTEGGWSDRFKLPTSAYLRTYLQFRDDVDDATESVSSAESDSSTESLDEHEDAKGGPRHRDEDDPGQDGGRRIAKDGPFKGQTAPSYYGDDDVL